MGKRADAEALGAAERAAGEGGNSMCVEHVAIIVRVFMRLERQVMNALHENRFDDAMALSGLIGKLQYEVLGSSCIGDLEGAT